MTNNNGSMIITYEWVWDGSSERKEAIKGQSQIYEVSYFTKVKWLVYSTSSISHSVVREKSAG